MPNRVSVGVYWGIRPITLALAIQQTLQAFEGLSRIHEVLSLSTWYEKGMSKEEALNKPVILSEGTLRRLLQEGRNRYDTTDEIMEDLGYSFTLWNGRDDEDGVSLNVTCGNTNPRLNNHCLLSTIEPSGTLFKPGTLDLILNALIETFQPDWGRVRPWIPELDLERTTPGVGWLTYLSPAYQPIPSLPSGVKVISRPDHSTLIQLSEEPFDSRVPEHIKRIQETTTALKQAGIVKPV
ncbi:hypothetical protein ARNL5_00918 [Anaerolineae bacterium]|nr:hypothetical protein ARNL5_00918 [Anaerolineae bacterium]